MLYLLDTNIAIRMRDGDEETLTRVEVLEGDACISVVTRIELEGGIWRSPDDVVVARQRLDVLFVTLRRVPFDEAAAAEYRGIIEAAGFSRPRILDRMIASQALALDATLVTLNGKDFADIPGLKLLAR